MERDPDPERQARIEAAMEAAVAAGRELIAGFNAMSRQLEALDLVLDPSRGEREVDLFLWDMQAAGELRPFD
jgi:hypothetical protein